MAVRTVTLDEQVAAEIGQVKANIAKALVPRGRGVSLYDVVVQELSDGTRNTPAQLRYLDAYEQALAVFRAAAYQLRLEMDVLGLEQRLEARQNAASQDNESPDALRKRITDAIVFSNRYGLFLAGNIGLSLLGLDKRADIQNQATFGAQQDAGKDKEEHTSMLARQGISDLTRVLAERRKQPSPVTDDDLKYTLEAVFSAWVKQFNWNTFKEVTEPFGLDKTRMQYGQFSAEGGLFQRKYTTVQVDERFMLARRADIIGSEGYVKTLWNSMIQLLAYSHERRQNPYNPPGCVFTFGAPGGGKTFITHALVRELEQVCTERGIPLLALTHSTTDYASHYQNLTANQLSDLATRIRNFPGPVIMYVADADNIFLSRNDPNLTAEQRQTLSVYFKMFDGQLIPKNGKFMAVMDANYIEGIDDATKSRLFDLILELPRYDKADDFASLARMQLTKGLGSGVPITDAEWVELGQYLLQTPLSNREIGHVVSGIRRNFEMPEAMIGAPFEEHVAYRNSQLHDLMTKASVMRSFDSYIENRLEAERKAALAQQTDDRMRFLDYLNKMKGDSTASTPAGQ